MNRPAPVTVPSATPSSLGRSRARRSGRLALGLLPAAIAVLAVSIAGICLGSLDIPLSATVHALLHSGTDLDTLVVRTDRLPRTIAGLLTGVALGLAGTVMQAVTRNPLADPGLLGVNAGAAAAIVCGLTFFGLTTTGGYIGLAFAGAALAAVVVYLVAAAGPAGPTPVSLALAGAAVTALLYGLTSMMLLRNVNAFDSYRRWTVGSLAGRSGADLVGVAPFLLAGLLLVVLVGRSLNVMALGADVARALGQHVRLIEVGSLAAVVLLSGSATALAGPVVFVGLAVPHVARWITGPDYRWIAAYAALLGPVLVIGADLIGRLAGPPGEIGVGVVTALIGAPVFVALVRSRRRVVTA